MRMEEKFYEELDQLKTLIEINDRTGADRHRDMVTHKEDFLAGFMSCARCYEDPNKIDQFERDYLDVVLKRN